MTEKSVHRGLFTLAESEAYLSREPRVKVEALGEGLWTAQVDRYRTIFLEANDSVIAVDTFGTPGAARAYARAVAQAIPGKSIGTVIYSHDHLDHAGFAADLAPDAEIIADDMTARVVALRQADGQSPVTRRLQGRFNEIEVDGLNLQAHNPGPTHGSGNLALFLPRHKVLFMSDTILPNARYGLLADYHIWNFVAFMRGLMELDFQTFVPGRYEVMTRDQFERGCDYFADLQNASQMAFVEGVPVWILEAITEYVRNKLHAEYSDLDGFEEQVGLTAFRIAHHYLMGGWGLEDTPAAGYNLAS